MSDRYYARSGSGEIVAQVYARDCATASRALTKMLDRGDYEVLRREKHARDYFLVFTFSIP